MLKFEINTEDLIRLVGICIVLFTLSIVSILVAVYQFTK